MGCCEQIPLAALLLQDRQRIRLTRLDIKAADVLEGFRRIAVVDPGQAVDGDGRLRKLAEMPPEFQGASTPSSSTPRAAS